MGGRRVRKYRNNILWCSLPLFFVIMTHILFLTHLKDLVLVFLVLGYPLATIGYTAISVYQEKQFFVMFVGIVLAAIGCLVGPLSSAFQFWLIIYGVCFVITYIMMRVIKLIHNWCTEQMSFK